MPAACLPAPFCTAEPYRLYNLDVFEYLNDSPFGLYGAIPLLMAHRPGQSVGVFWWVGGSEESGESESCLSCSCLR